MEWRASYRPFGPKRHHLKCFGSLQGCRFNAKLDGYLSVFVFKQLSVFCVGPPEDGSFTYSRFMGLKSHNGTKVAYLSPPA
jgi:hypothetical protein